jgi:hypothetical protein
MSLVGTVARQTSGMTKINDPLLAPRPLDRRSEEEVKSSWQSSTLPLVSVLCPTYNHVDFIEDAMAGFMGQVTDFPFEVIVRDDSSTDGTTQLVKKWSKEYPNIVRSILNETNQYSLGKKAAPVLLGKARGKYVAFCEGDDYWIDPQKLQIQVSILEEDPELSGCLADAYVLNTRKSEATLQRQGGVILEKERFTLEDFLGRWFAPTSGIVVRRECLYPLPSWIMACDSMDIPMWALAALHGPFFAVQRPLSVYRLHPGGVSVLHAGLRKAVSMAHIYRNLDVHTGFAHHSLIEQEVLREFRQHLARLIKAPPNTAPSPSSMPYMALVWELFARPQRKAFRLLKQAARDIFDGS